MRANGSISDATILQWRIPWQWYIQLVLLNGVESHGLNCNDDYDSVNRPQSL